MPGLRIICEGEVIEADLLEDDAPRICAYLRSVLPMDGTMVHAKFAGEETIVMVPFFAEQENPKLNVVPGEQGRYEYKCAPHANMRHGFIEVGP